MASEQFIIEMHRKLHPRSKKNCYGELTGKDIEEITAIIDKKHAIGIGSSVLGSGVCVDLEVLRHIMTSASLGVSAKMQEMEAENVHTLLDHKDGWDEEAMKDWMINYKYYKEQKIAIDLIEKEVLDALRDKTNEKDFYLS